MARTVGIGIQDFETIIKSNCFYIDKTAFIKEWWEGCDNVTLITRPRRFGKTLTISMLEKFFSIKYVGRGDLFEGLSIWNEQKYRELQGAYPVISLSFANVKEVSYPNTVYRICELLKKLFEQNRFLLDCPLLSRQEKEYYERMTGEMTELDAPTAINQLCDFLHRYYGKNVIILLDEYDTPMQEAYVGGFWNELVAFTRSLFNSTFKTNQWLERGIMTGITRVSKESVFSDLNNLKVVTTTSNEYAGAFGFTEGEVFAAMDEYGLDKKENVKFWYDGFTFGNTHDIYNPWSIINYLDTQKFNTYWANTSSNSLVSKLLQSAEAEIKEEFNGLLLGKSVVSEIDEQIVYNQLDSTRDSIWSFLLASGYLKILNVEDFEEIGFEEWKQPRYELALTNFEVRCMFENMIKNWFAPAASSYSRFIKAMFVGDIEAMNEYMGRMTRAVFSFFDVPKSDSPEPERFYHGFVLGLLVELREKYKVTSNRESGFGRYDIMLEPKNSSDIAVIIEFKIYNARRDASLEDTVRSALQQIADKKYEQALLESGISAENIRKYGFAFCGKEVLIGV